MAVVCMVDGVAVRVAGLMVSVLIVGAVAVTVVVGLLVRSLEIGTVRISEMEAR